MNEFFNRRVGRIFYTDQPTPGGIGEIHVVRLDADDGELARARSSMPPAAR